MTFVWRGAADTRHVAVIDGVVVGIVGADPVKSLLSRLLETDVWYRTYIVRNDARFHYWLSPNDMLKSLLEPIHSKPKQDPLNSRVLYSGGPSYVELSEVALSSFTPVAGNPAGKVEHTSRRSAILNNERDVWVYTPPGFSVTAKPYPLLIATDGMTYTSSIPVPVILDNLIASKRIPPLVAVFVGNVDGLRGLNLDVRPRSPTLLRRNWSPGSAKTTMLLRIRPRQLLRVRVVAVWERCLQGSAIQTYSARFCRNRVHSGGLPKENQNRSGWRDSLQKLIGYPWSFPWRLA